MNKKMRELMALINKTIEEAKAAKEAGDYDKAAELLETITAKQREFEVEKALFEAEKGGAPTATPTAKPEETDATKEFCKAFRLGFQKGLLSEGVDEDGGYVVPFDVTTAPERFPEVTESLLPEIEVVNVKTNKGSRTFLSKGKPNVFTEVEEGAALTNEIDAPQFERHTYDIKDRAGYMPVSNDLLADSDANIKAFVEEWLGKAVIETTNANILKAIETNPQTDLTNFDGIKKALIVTLGAGYRAGAKIITNDDGLFYLSTLKDGNGRDLVSPIPTEPGKMQLAIGAMTFPIKVLSNETLPTKESKIPFIIGNLKNFCRKYDRQKFSIFASNVAAIGSLNAFSQNLTIFKGMLRDDYKVKDASAIVRGYITKGE